MKKTYVPWGRELVQSVLDTEPLSREARDTLQFVIDITTRHQRKGRTRVKNPPVNAALRARIVAEIAKDDGRQDVEIAMAVGFPTPAGAARVSEVRNGVA